MPNDAETSDPARRPDTSSLPGQTVSAGFNALYAGEAREVIRQIAHDAIAAGANAEAQARAYAERGKPDFALAYLLAGALADDDKRAIYATAFERRAALTEGKAREFDQKFRRPFPLLATDAAQDRARARRVLNGQGLSKGVGKQLPMT